MQSINGNESKTHDSKLNAVIDFYHAFNHQEMSAVALNWHQDNQVIMSNPLGGVKKGWQEIEAVYEKIFNGSAKLHVEFYDFSLHAGTEMFVIAGRERAQLIKNNEKILLAIRTSRVFQFVHGDWKQIHHHGSIEEPETLKKYQTILRGNTK